MPALKTAPSGSNMTAEQAIATAMAYVKSLPQNAEHFGKPRLEEIERGKGKGKGAWMITISHAVPREDESPFNVLAGIKFSRSYKVITIDSASGEVLSMKIRRL